MNEKYKLILSYIIGSLIVIGVISLFFGLSELATFEKFMHKIESSSFDLRQMIISGKKQANKDIVVVAIDDETYEYVMNNYGEWPVSRKIWADAIEYIEQAQPKNIVFDLLFVKPNLKDTESDKKFITAVKNNDNIYLSINFDNYSEKTRKPPILDDKFKLKLDEGNLFDNSFITFLNARVVMDELSLVTDNIGAINVTRDEDGILRNLTPIFKYKEDYYPNLSLKVAMDLLGKDSISIKNNTIILDETHSIPLDETQRAILNWYGGNGTYTHIPLWEIIEAQKENNKAYLEKFKGKIIYVGATVTSLSDIKSTPVESRLAGVELHTTFLNNILDNNFIKKIPAKYDILISFLLSIMVGYCVLKTASVLKTIVLLLVTLTFLATASIFVMTNYNLWMGLILPFTSTITTFILIYCVKYLLKSKDYEQTYKLAVTDGLTQLYNHRYFQEQMINNVNAFNRYGTKFSLILVDIDFFKKFNDTYGHQSGDAVLKQVASLLKKNSRTSDIACRYGGEEMSIILTSTNKEDAVATANKICLAIRNNKFTLVGGEKVNVTISVGVATVGDNGSKPQEMIEFADKCLYIAKENGRNQVVSEVN